MDERPNSQQKERHPNITKERETEEGREQPMNEEKVTCFSQDNWELRPLTKFLLAVVLR